MHDNIAVQMMQRCLSTIEQQRAHIAHLAPKAEAYDRIGVLLDARYNQNRSLSGLGGDVDIIWQLRKEIEKTQQRMSEEKSRADTERESQDEIGLRRSASNECKTDDGRVLHGEINLRRTAEIDQG